MASTAANQVVEFVRALALGWKNLAAYPPGHPVLITSMDLIHRRLSELRGPAGEIVLGVARDGVLYSQEKIDSTYAQKFGNALYTRGVAILRFDTSTDVKDIETFLHLLGGSTDSDRPIWEELTAAGVISIHLQAVDYSEVKVSDDLAEERPKTDAEEMWENIVQAIIAGKEMTPEGKRLLAQKVRSASELAALILQYATSIDRPTEYDPDATFGVKFTYRVGEQGGEAAAVADRMADAVGAFISDSLGARRDTAVEQAIELLKSLPDSMRATVMRSVLRALGGDDSAAALLRDVAENLPNDEVLDALRYLSNTMSLSNHAVRLLESLMATSIENVPMPASPSLVTDLVNLFGEDDIDRWNPEDHSQLLDQVSVQIPDTRSAILRPMSDLGERLTTISTASVTEQLAGTLLNLLRTQGARHAPWTLLKRLEQVFADALEESRFDVAVTIVRELQETAIVATNPAQQEAIYDTFEHIATPDIIRGLIDTLHASPSGQNRALEELLEILGSAAAKNLVTMLAEENNRSRRRRLFDFVSSLGNVVVPEIRPFFSDNRWYVVRNMIALVRSINDRSLLNEVRRCASHPDLRVRLEAIRTLIELDPTPPTSLLEDAIRDPDPKIAEKAITLVGSYGIKEAVDPLLQVVDGNDVWGAKRPLRIRALRALGELAEPSALPRLQRFFTDSLLPWPAKEERRVAYESLAGYPQSARQTIVEKGLRSRDPYVREICERMANGH